MSPLQATSERESEDANADRSDADDGKSMHEVRHHFIRSLSFILPLSPTHS